MLQSRNFLQHYFSPRLAQHLCNWNLSSCSSRRKSRTVHSANFSAQGESVVDGGNPDHKLRWNRYHLHPKPPPLTTASACSTSSLFQMQPLLSLFHLSPLLPRFLGFDGAFTARSVGPGSVVYSGGVGPAFSGRLSACSSWLGLG